MKVYITFATSILIDVTAGAPPTKKDAHGIMMRALQAQDQCWAEGTVLGLCLESAGVTDHDVIKACGICPLDAIVVTGFDYCSASDVDGFYAYVQRCGVDACHTSCRDELQAWLGIPILDSDSWDYRNPEFRFRKRNSGTFRRNKPENLWRESVPS